MVKTAGATGDVLWRRTLAPAAPLFFDTPRAIATDAGGDVIAAGSVTGSMWPQFTVVKLAGGNGEERWRSVTMGAEPGSSDGATAVAMASDGDVVAAGQTTGTITGSDLTVVRLAAAGGRERWRAVLTPAIGGDDDRATAVGIDADGNVVAAGGVEYAPSGITVLTVAKLAGATGRQLWRASGLDADDEPRDGVAHALAIAADGTAVAAGYIDNAAGAPEGVVLSLDAATGAERWRLTLPSAAGEYSTLRAVRVDAAGDVIAAGILEPGPDSAVIVLKLDGRSGVERWRRLFGAGDRATASGVQLALGAGGDALVGVIVDDELELARLDATTGADVWRRPTAQVSFEFSGDTLIADRDGNPVVVSSFVNPGAGSDLGIRKVSGDTGGDAICGDGIRAPAEACDDGNRRDVDCCSAACVVEVAPACGDPDGPNPRNDPDVACAGQNVPRGIVRGIAKGERLVQAADTATKPRRVTRLTQRAERALRKTARLIERAAAPRRRKPALLTAVCAASLRDTVVALRASVSGRPGAAAR